MTIRDSEKYYKLCTNENVMRFVTGHALTRAESDLMLADMVKGDNGKTWYGRYFVEDRYDGSLVGAARLDLEGTEVEIGYRVQEEYWGRGIATEIAITLIQFTIKKLKVFNVIAHVNVDNHASVRVLEKAGMRNVGIIEDIDEIKYKFVYSPKNISPMKKVLYFIFGLLALILIAALVIPKELSVEKEIVINKPKAQVFDFLKSLENQAQWTKWAKLDPNMKNTYSGTPGTVGSMNHWEGNDEVGVGEQEIKRIIEGERIDTEVRFIKPFESKSDAFLITETQDSTHTLVKWGFNSVMPIPMNLMIPLMGLKKSVGADYQQGLDNLKGVLEAK